MKVAADLPVRPSRLMRLRTLEFGNRLVGGIAIALSLVAALAARRARSLPRSARGLVAAVFLGTLAQAPLGYLTVRFHLNP